MKTHRLDAAPETVHWGYFDANLKPLITIDSGDEVVISTVSGGPGQLPKPGSGLTVPDALPAIHAKVAPKLGGPHILTGPVADTRRQGRPGARGPHQGRRAQLRLGLQHHSAARRCAAGRFRRAAPHPHSTRQQTHGRATAVGSRTAAQAVLRHHGGGAACRVGAGVVAATATERRQSRQQGTGRRHDAVSARSMPTARCSLAATVTAYRATAKFASRRSKPASPARSNCMCATTCRWNGRWLKHRPTS